MATKQYYTHVLIDNFKQTTVYLEKKKKKEKILQLIPSLCFLISFHVWSILFTAFSLLICPDVVICCRCLCTDLISSPCPSVFHLQSDIYFVSSAPVSSASNCSSRDTSSQSSPQTPTGYEMPVFPSPLGDGKPRTVKAPQDVGISASLWKVFKCQRCLQTCLTLDAAVFAQSSRTIYINVQERFIEAAELSLSHNDVRFNFINLSRQYYLILSHII